MNFRLSLFLSMVAASAFMSNSTLAGGIGLGATRVIYNESSSQASIHLNNSDTHERFLIQSWVTGTDGKKNNNFIVTPPLFAAPPKSENTLRIMYTGAPLPGDREVAYWLNVKSIPAVNPESVKGKNVLQLAVLTRIKLFMRPEGLPMSERESPEHLRFRQSAGHLTIDNPTPYYQSIVSLSVGGKSLPNTMVSPMDKVILDLPAGAAGAVKYQTVNDFGALTEARSGQNF
ncbi:fimbria/pilus periplasmic chaperone [Enterobacter cloacae]|uniref:fimbria/pilus periplasmic chaperone n=1 Tax=Enterobacter cloacae TaxID=550 RepID=UPI0032D9B937